MLAIVAVQMGVTFGFACMATLSTTAGNFFKHPLTIILSFVLLMTCVCVIASSRERRKRVPENYMWLAGATLGESVFIASAAADITFMSLFVAIMATCFSVVGLFIAALYTASSVEREVLIRNMVKGLIACFFLNLFMLLFIMVSFSYQDKGMVMAVGIIMCLISGAYIMFAMLFIIVPGLEE